MAKNDPTVPNVHANAVSGLDHEPLPTDTPAAEKLVPADPNETAPEAPVAKTAAKGKGK